VVVWPILVATLFGIAKMRTTTACQSDSSSFITDPKVCSAVSRRTRTLEGSVLMTCRDTTTEILIRHGIALNEAEEAVGDEWEGFPGQWTPQIRRQREPSFELQLENDNNEDLLFVGTLDGQIVSHRAGDVNGNGAERGEHGSSGGGDARGGGITREESVVHGEMTMEEQPGTHS
jgi:hypothetical protein